MSLFLQNVALEIFTTYEMRFVSWKKTHMSWDWFTHRGGFQKVFDSYWYPETMCTVKTAAKCTAYWVRSILQYAYVLVISVHRILQEYDFCKKCSYLVNFQKELSLELKIRYVIVLLLCTLLTSVTVTFGQYVSIHTRFFSCLPSI